MIHEILVSSISDTEKEILIGIEREKVKKIEFVSKDILEDSSIPGLKIGTTFLPLVVPSGILEGRIKVKHVIVTEKIAVGVTKVVGFLKPVKEMTSGRIADFVNKVFETTEGIVFLIDPQKIHSSRKDMDIMFEHRKIEKTITSDSKEKSLILLNYEGKDWIVEPNVIKGITEKMNVFKIGKIKGFVTYENNVIPVFGNEGKWIVIFENVGLLCKRIDRVKGTILNIGEKEKWAIVSQQKIPFLDLEGVKEFGI